MRGRPRVRPVFLPLIRKIGGESVKRRFEAFAQGLVFGQGEEHRQLAHVTRTALALIQIFLRLCLGSGEARQKTEAEKVDILGRLMHHASHVVMPKSLACGDRQRGLRHLERLKREHKCEPKRGVAFAAFGNRLDDIARGPAFLDLLKRPIAEGKIRALERLRRKLALRPAIDVPIAPEFLGPPRKLNGDGQRRAHLAPVEVMNLSPPLCRMVGKIAQQAEGELRLLGKEARERLMQRRRREVVIVMTIYPDIVEVKTVGADWEKYRFQRAALLRRTIRLRDGAQSLNPFAALPLFAA